MRNLLEHYDLLFAMTILTAFAILLKCICAIVYQVLLRDSEQITSTKNKWLRSIITKYEACYKLKMPIYNTDSFIKHYIERYHFLGFSMKTLENFDYFCGLIVTGSTLFSIMCGIYYELPNKWILIHSMTLVLFLVFLATSELLFQVRYKKKVLHLQLVNHFDNTMRAKLESQYLHPEERIAYQNEYFQPDKPVETNVQAQKTEPMEESQIASGITPDMQELIDSLREETKITEELKETQEKLSAAATNEKYRLVEEIIKEYL